MAQKQSAAVETLKGLSEDEKNAALAELIGADDLEALQDVRRKRRDREMRSAIKDRTDEVLGLVEDVDSPNPDIAKKYADLSRQIDEVTEEAEQIAEAAVKAEFEEASSQA